VKILAGGFQTRAKRGILQRIPLAHSSSARRAGCLEILRCARIPLRRDRQSKGGDARGRHQIAVEDCVALAI
jgi:hypothetical protein